MSLLDAALNIPSNQRRKNAITDEEIELALAWMNDKVSLKQVMKAIGQQHPSGVPGWLSIRIREAYRRDHIVIS